VYNGIWWIIPYLGGNSALVINRGMFNDMGLTEPKTIEEFESMGKKVTNAGENFYATQFCIAEKNVTGANVCNIGPLLYSFGGAYVENKKAAFNNQQGVETIQWMIDMAEKDKIAGPGSITVDARKMRETMASENTLMTFDGAWGIPFYANYPELNIDYILMPKKENIGTVVNIACWGISKSSEYQDTAWDLLTYIYNDENLKMLYEDGNMPNVKKFGEQQKYQEKYSGFLETLGKSDNYFRTGSVPQESDMYRIVVQAYHEAFLGQKDVKTALDDAADKYNKILDEFYSK
jgi:ABC-type glycerol-3-phosphate transport system substrate-binding protein